MTATRAAQPQVVPALPFTASAHEHTERAFEDSRALTAAVQQINPQDVPAYGYIRHLFIEIECTGGGGASLGVAAADAPWNILESVTLQDVNGANIVGPIDGYALYLANVIGGYAGAHSDPAQAPFHVGASPNFRFFLRVPVEISARDGLGALANQNAAANYKLSYSLNAAGNVYSTLPTTLPTVTVRAWLEAWTLPATQDDRGRPQAQVPPLLGTGQYWSSTRRSILAGSNTLGVTRVGNYIRALVLLARDTAGARSDAVFPDPLEFNWDGNMIHKVSQRYLQQHFREKVPGAFARPTGVLVFPFNHAGAWKMGNESPDLWLPTTQSSRIEIAGNSAAAGSLQMLVNEVAPVEMNQAERYETPSESGSLQRPAQ